jgi:ABC-type phosphate transport system ATPase subunit
MERQSMSKTREILRLRLSVGLSVRETWRATGASTGVLDPGTESLVEQAMRKLMRGRTVILIAQRLSTAAQADRVGVVEGGRLVELGTHRDLLARGGRYAALFAKSASAGGLAGALVGSVSTQ